MQEVECKGLVSFSLFWGGWFLNENYSNFYDLRDSQLVLVVKNPPTKSEDVRNTVSIPGSGRSPKEGNDIPLQYSC